MQTLKLGNTYIHRARNQNVGKTNGVVLCQYLVIPVAFLNGLVTLRANVSIPTLWVWVGSIT